MVPALDPSGVAWFHRPMAKRAEQKQVRPWRALPLRRWLLRGALAVVVALVLVVLGYAVLPVPTTPYQIAEARRLGGIEKEWVPLEQVSAVMQRSAVAAEDANYCEHWGFDIAALRAAVEGGARRGGSTITQQTVKNVFLWQGRSWPRKAFEAVLTPMVELVWSKRRILEIYLNVIEFGDGIFGVQAAAQQYFGIDAAELSAVQAARLAAILPAPKDRDPVSPTASQRRRSAAILDGAETIRRDGRAGCFQD